jgi:hypothetical protein
METFLLGRAKSGTPSLNMLLAHCFAGLITISRLRKIGLALAQKELQQSRCGTQRVDFGRGGCRCYDIGPLIPGVNTVHREL